MAGKRRIAILGAGGYTGAELIRLLLAHPHAEIGLLTGDSQAGKAMAEVYPHLTYADLPPLVTGAKADYSAIDCVFCCLPHGHAQEVIAALPGHVKIIDLSADFRLSDPQSYAAWYGHVHRAPELQREAIYGLTEAKRDAVRTARLVANPGCYPTSAQLPLLPLLKAGLVETQGIVIDSKSGVTGAGRAVRQGSLYAEVSGGISAYGVASHRHAPEIEQELALAAGQPVTVSFTPHLIPMNRGILSTIYVTLRPGAGFEHLREALEEAYCDEAFVKLTPPCRAPSTHSVRGTNLCLIGLFADRQPGRAILVSALDNLVKGASGQAVQNMNVMCGYPETTGLLQGALFP